MTAAHRPDDVADSPLVELARFATDGGCTLLALLDFANAGGTHWERAARRALDETRDAAPDLETVVTWGPPALCAAHARYAAAAGLDCVAVVADDTSQQERNAIAAYGAQLRVCPAGLSPDDPSSPRAAARRVAREARGAALCGGESSPSSSHREFPGELCAALGAALHTVVASVAATSAAGGTTAAGVHLIGVQLGEAPDRGGAPDFSELVTVPAREAFLAARRLARKEGVLAGPESGAVLAAARRAAEFVPAGRTLLAVLPDGGTPWLDTLYDDGWMRRNGYLADGGDLTAGDILARKEAGPGELVLLSPTATVAEAIRIMQDLEVSQIPIVQDDVLVGTLREDQVIDLLLHAPERKDGPVSAVMEDALPEVGEDASVEEIQSIIVGGKSAVLVRRGGGRREILTKYDLIHGLARDGVRR